MESNEIIKGLQVVCKCKAVRYKTIRDAIKNGANTFQYEANDFSSGVYWIEIEGNDWKLNLDRFFKGK